jgi:YVTN family beta-propeller protein
VTGSRGPARFLTTVLFTDIVGSTEHAAELGDHAFHELIQLHHGIVRAALKRHGGKELDTAGDGFFAVFDAPAAAVDCALEIAATVGEQLGIEIRAGLHVGEVQQSGPKVSGIAVVIGSRIMSGAGPSEVLVSGTVRDLTAGSGLTFEDRGVRELKGVPGTWPIYAVARAGEAGPQHAAGAVGASRRAAAVRRAHDRPIWERRPRVVAGITVVLALVVGVSGLFVWSPWRPPALAAVTENSVGVIDVDRAEVIGAVQVGSRPGGIAVGEGSAWVTNTGADTVSQIDLATRAVVNTIEVGRGPAGIAAADGSIWVANSGDRTVSQVNVVTGREVASIVVGNGPTAIAVGDDAVWVANTSDSTIVRLDPDSGDVGEPIGVAAGPIALAVDDSGVWVVSQDGGAVTRIDPASGATIDAPILLSSRPTALAVGAGSVWVAGSDGTVTGIDPESGRVTHTLDIGGSLSSIVVTDRSIYVADLQGSVYEVNVANPGSPRRITIENAAQALAVVQGQVWVATRASTASHRGGTLRVVSEYLPELDPATGVPLYHFASFQADGLVAYPRVGGIAGSTLLPDLATSIPKPTNGGKTYTFQLRPGLVYADGSEVRSEDFRRGIERGFQIPDPFSGDTIGPFYFSSIVGAEACSPGPVDRCDLSEGIATDDVSRTVTFNLSEPDPDFLYKLALIHAYPAPSSVPTDAPVDGAFPGTGPYTVASVSETEIRLVRNPNFTPWSSEVRPDGFPEEIIWTKSNAPDEQVAMVERGEADYVPLRFAIRSFSPQLFADLRRQYPAQLHAASSSLVFAFMNTALPPFDRLEARQAVSMAIDRGHIAELFGGAFGVTITCQVLPPGYPGYRPYCPYTADPDPGGRWQAPDLEAARSLVDASGTRGARVVVGPVLQRHTNAAKHLVAVLRELGYKVTLDSATSDEEVFRAVFDEGRVQIGVFEWFGDSLAPSGFLSAFTCDGSVGMTNLCDRGLEARMADAAALQPLDPAAAANAWAAIDREITDLAVWAPLVNQGTDFVSARVGNYQFHPAYLVLLDQLWVQ